MIIELEKIKGIARLDFEIPGQGLWLLTGLNGSGKTSLLAALYRIRHGRAFQDYYKTTATQNKLDTFKDSKVRYKINGNEVTYSYGGKRWPPTPRRNAAILNQFPYSSIQFIEANGSRIEPYPDEIVPRRINSANNNVKAFMSTVLGEVKWNDLKYVNTRRGTGNQAFLLPYRSGRETHYYSEKNFSLGELSVLRLANKLVSAHDRSMILIDEIEMALHPQAQVRLLRKLEEVVAEKILTVIFSTHSSTLIKNIRRNKIILLSNEGGGVFKAKTNVYPAHVLGEIAFDEEINADFIFYVEDEQAKILLEQLCGKYEENRSSHKPMFKVVPVGGYYQVLKMLDRSVQLFPNHVKRFAFLDDDVRTESLPQARRDNMTEIIELYDRLTRQVKFLPCTPELGVIGLLEDLRDENNNRELNLEYYGVTVRLNNHLTSNEYTSINCDSPRKTAKSKLDSVVSYIERMSGNDEMSIRRSLYRKYADHRYRNIGELMALLGPVFDAR